MLDTNALIWWTTAPEKLSKKARNFLEKHIKEEMLISSISIWEVYALIKKSKLRFLTNTDIWLESLESLSYVKFAPVDNRIAAQSVKLPDLDEADPADRIIIATAMINGAMLITSDKKILDYPHVKSVW